MNTMVNGTSFPVDFSLAGFFSSGLYLHCSFIIEGVVLCAINGLLLVTILLVKSLRKRKEMIIMSGMAMADFTFGSGATLLGIYRIGLMISGQASEPATSWECARLPPMFLINIGLQLTALMNFVVSIDRLCAVTWPQEYRARSTRIAKNSIAAVGIFFIVSLSTMLVSTCIGDSQPNQTRMCFGRPFKDWYSRFEFLFIIAVEYLSVAVYIQVYIQYKRILGKVSPSALYEPHMFLQRRLTVTMMITTASTFVFFILPMTTVTLNHFQMITLPSTQVLLFFTRVNRIVNICVYIFRQKEVRRAMRKVIRCN